MAIQRQLDGELEQQRKEMEKLLHKSISTTPDTAADEEKPPLNEGDEHAHHPSY